MVILHEIEDLCRDVCQGRLGARFVRVALAPAIGSDGEDTLAVTIVLTEGTALTGRELIAVLVDLQHALTARGEPRFPVVSYTTEQELTEAAADEAREQQAANEAAIDAAIDADCDAGRG